MSSYPEGGLLRLAGTCHLAVSSSILAFQGAESQTRVPEGNLLYMMDLQDEPGPVIKTMEGQEHAAFLQLWDGGMTVFKGQHEDTFEFSSSRLWVVQSGYPVETFLKEVKCSITSLRARGVFLLLTSHRQIFLWIGRASEQQEVTAGRTRGEEWLRSSPRQLGLHPTESELEEVEQGCEPGLFWAAMGGGAGLLQRFTDGEERLTAAPRLFDLTSATKPLVVEVRPERVGGFSRISPLLHSQVE